MTTRVRLEVDESTRRLIEGWFTEHHLDGGVIALALRGYLATLGIEIVDVAVTYVPHPDDEADVRAAFAELKDGKGVTLTLEDAKRWAETGLLPRELTAKRRRRRRAAKRWPAPKKKRRPSTKGVKKGR